MHGVRGGGAIGGALASGAPNEVWSFGEEAYALIREQLELREGLRPYIADQMKSTAATGLPPMRAMFLEFPKEPEAWGITDQFLFGPDILVAPVTQYKARSRKVYLPTGAAWRDAWSGAPISETGWIDAPAPLARIPVFLREGGALAVLSAGNG